VAVHGADPRQGREGRGDLRMRPEPVRWGRGFAAGAAGGVAAVLVLFGYRVATGMPTLQEALAERMIRLLPYQIFALILEKLQHLAKPLGLGMAIATSIVGFGAGGVLYAWLTRRSERPRVVLGVAAAIVTWLFLTFVFLPFIEGGALGAALTTVVTAPALPMALASLAYGLLLAVLSGRPSSARAQAALRTGAAPTDSLSRRDLLRRSALLVLAAAAGTRLAAWTSTAGGYVAAAAAQAFSLLKGMPSEITPNGKWYQVSKNFFDPTVDVPKWSLEVKGRVAKTLRFSLDEFRKAAPPVERYQTFECISNEVGGDLISNAKWKGVRVKDILALADVQPGSTTIIWRAADGFSESIPLAVAMDPETLLAYEMNGEPIPQKHGAPVRVLLLNRYGMKQPKWLTSIEVANHDYTGYWEEQGWSKEALVKTNSAFRVEQTSGGTFALGGWAFAGNRGISKVEVTADDGKTWFPAAVKEPLGANCWQFWSAEWKPPAKGDYALKVRAFDGTGKPQPVGPKATLPDGGEGYHAVRVHFTG
jgi:DMSO/TMAO reductase YedYZ molybdopterin-dependent catalytic subunit